MPVSSRLLRILPCVLVSALLGLACGGGGGGDPAAMPPNLVLIIGDDHGYPDFGFMGSDVARTPHLDRLAAEGVVFRVGYSTASLCRPALRTLLTGLEPIQYGRLAIEGRDEREDADRAGAWLVREVGTLPRLLAERGYASFQAGKYAEGHYRTGGFSEGMVEHGGALGMRATDRLVRETLDPVLDFVSRSADAPFFLWFAPKLPHLPHDPPARFRALYEESDLGLAPQLYYASISWFDDAVGRLVEHVETLGLARRTLFVYLADNGWDPRPPGDTRFAALGGPQGKKTLYELGFRTPIVLRWTGGLEGGAVRDELVSIADVFPTLLDYAGVTPPSGRLGRSLRPLLEGSAPWTRTALIGWVHVVRTDRPQRLMGGFFWRDPRWHYLQPAQRPPELYDLRVDPREVTDVSAQHPDVVERARKAIDAWIHTVSETNPPAFSAPAADGAGPT